MHFSQSEDPKNSNYRLALASLIFIGVCVTLSVILVKVADIDLPLGLGSEKPNEISAIWYSKIGYENEAGSPVHTKP